MLNFTFGLKVQGRHLHVIESGCFETFLAFRLGIYQLFGLSGWALIHGGWLIK